MLARVRDYLKERRALGFRLRVEGRMLEDFGRFADRRGHRGPLTRKLAVRWSALPKAADRLYHARRLEVVHTFAKYLTISEPKTQVGPRNLFGPAHRRPDPYIYSSSEITELMLRAQDLSGNLRPETMRTLIGLIAATGLRISEALHLDVRDVDLEEGVLTVRCSKFRKTRLVPLHPTVMAPLKAYARKRQRTFPLVDAFFVSERGTRLSHSTAVHIFGELRKGVGSGRRAPRLQDLRHTFTCEVLLRWQRNRAGVGNRITILSRYLGHGHVTDTYWYLSALPQLMAEAGKHFRTFTDEKL